MADNLLCLDNILWPGNFLWLGNFLWPDKFLWPVSANAHTLTESPVSLALMLKIADIAQTFELRAWQKKQYVAEERNNVLGTLTPAH